MNGSLNSHKYPDFFVDVKPAIHSNSFCVTSEAELEGLLCMGDHELGRDQCLGPMVSPLTILPCNHPLLDSQNLHGN